MLKFNGKVMKFGNVWGAAGSVTPPAPVDPYNPLGLPPNTVRVRTSDGKAPNRVITYTSYTTATLVPGTTDVYDVYKSGTNFYRLLRESYNVIEVLGANTSGITNMGEMFNSCSSLTTVALFDTSSVTDMTKMFYQGNHLTSVPLFDTSNVTNMDHMFYHCDILTSVPLFVTTKVTNMDYMFSNCSSLATVPLFDTSSATSMNATFYYCTSLTAAPLLNTSKVTNTAAMFQNCTSLPTIPLYDTSMVTNMSGMCRNCYKVESGALALYQRASSQANPPTYYSSAFRDCGRDTTTGAAELAQIPSSWK